MRVGAILRDPARYGWVAYVRVFTVYLSIACGSWIIARGEPDRRTMPIHRAIRARHGLERLTRKIGSESVVIGASEVGTRASRDVDGCSR